MATLDSGYLNQLLHDAHLGSSDAYAAIYSGTLTELYRNVWRQLKDIYLTEDALQEIYEYIFQNIPGIRNAKQFYTLLDRRRDAVCSKIRQTGNAAPEGRTEGKSSSVPELTHETAVQLLENIFESCHMEPNKTSLDVLASYNRYRSRRYGLQQVIIILVVCILVVTPVLFIHPSFDIKDGKADSRTGYPTFTVDVNSRLIPVKSVVATIDEQTMPVYQTGQYTYQIRPSKNGKMSVLVTLQTNQSTSKEYDVEGIDNTPPYVTSSLYRNGKLYITIKDDGSGLNYNTVYLLDSKGSRHKPISENKITGVIGFDMAEGDLMLYASDMSGNKLTAALHLEPKE